MSNSRTHDLRDSVYVGALSLGVAFMSSTFTIRVIHTFVTSAGWEDSLDSNDPISSVVVMVAISGVAYNLLTKVKNRYGLIAPLEGAFWIIGLIPILFWIIHKGRVLPDLANSPYSGLSLVVAAVCLGVIRSLRLKSTLPSLDDLSPNGDDSKAAEEGGDEPLPHQPTSGRKVGNTTARRWMLGLAAGAVVAVAALVPQSLPLLPAESAPGPAEKCRDWHDTKVVSLYKGRLALWAEWSNALNAFVKESGRADRILSEIDTGVAPAALLSRQEAIRKWSAAQDVREVEFAIGMLDDHWDDNDVRRIATARMIDMQALMDVLTLEFLLADTAGFYPFPDSQGLETDLRRAALGLERACELERN